MSREFSAGTVYVQVLPSLDGWKKDLERQLKTELGSLKANIAVTPQVDARDFQRELDTALRRIRASVTVAVHADTDVADAKLAATDARLAALNGNAAHVSVDADTAAANAKLDEVERKVSALNGKTARVNVNADDGGSVDLASNRVERLIALAIAGSGAIGGLGAALLALGAGAVVGAAGVAAVVAGTASISAAMKAQTAATRQAGQTAAQEAAQQITSANQLASAQDGVKSAMQGVAEAQRSASNNVRTALLAQARAEEQVTVAQEAALRTQRALTDAKRDAARSIEDLQNQAMDDALAQRAAVLQLQSAQKNLDKIKADPTATERQREEAQLTFDQATQHLAETRLAYQRSSVDAAAAAKAGVDGSKQVVSAQEAVTASQRQLHDTQVAAEESARKVNEARIAGAQQVARAQQQVIAAQRSLQNAQAAVATQAAHQGEAQQKLAEALDKLAPESLRLIGYLRSQSGEWDSLGKASQQFAPGLQRSLQILQPSFGDLNDNVATVSSSFGSFLEVVAGGLVHAQPFFDVIAASSVELFPRFGETVNTAATAVGGLITALLPLAPEALGTVDALSGLVTVWTPFIAQASGPLLAALQDIIKNLDFLGPLLVSIAKPAADLTTTLVSGLRAGFQNLTPALGPFLQSLVDIVKTLSPLLGSAGQLAALAGKTLLPALQAVNVVLKPLVDLVGLLVDVISAVPTPLIGLTLGFLALQRAAAPLGRLISEAGAAIGTMVSVAGAGTAAAGRFATAGNGVAAVFRGIGAAVPFVGLAFLGLSEILSANAEEARKGQEAADKLGAALNRGGAAAAAAESAIRRLRLASEAYGDGQSGISKKLKEQADAAEASARKQAAGMSAVELAQGRVTQAQADYDAAVRNSGPTSAAAITAHSNLANSLAGLKDAQNDAAEATKTHTEKLQDQQDQILAMTDANVAHERAGLQLQQGQSRLNEAIADNATNNKDAAKAQKELTTATQRYGRTSAQAKAAQDKYNTAAQKAADSSIAVKEAQLDLTSAQSRYVSTAGAAAAATAKTSGAQDTSAAKVKGTNEALIELLRTQGQSLPATTLSMISHLSDADKKFFGLTTTVDTTGRTILQLPGAPGQPPVSITFTDNVPQVQKDVEDLKVTIKGFFDYYFDLIKQAPQGPAPVVPLPLPSVGSVNIPGRAAGGPIPGAGAGDTVPAMLTPGEFVFSRPAVQNLGLGTVAALHAKAARGYARGGLVQPLRFAAGGAVPSGADVPPELGWLAQIALLFEDVTTAASPLSSALDTAVGPALRGVTSTSDALAQATRTDWLAITSAVGDAVNLITGTHLVALRAGLSAVDTALANTVSLFATRWAAIRGYAADPVRYALQFPFNGLVLAWNTIDSAFAVGKPLAPIPIGFAAGGPITGGRPGRDSVLAALMPGEFVMPVPMVNQIGLGNLESARRSVLAGGSVEGLVPGFEAGGAVSKALAFAASQVGKPYIWGAVGPAGYDCSGLVSAVSNVALGLNPYQRRFQTADFAASRGAGGYLPGRGSSLVIGVSDSHMAGTLAGHNFESTTKNGISGVRVDGDASGALDAQFTKGQFYLPQVGGSFIPGPTGGAAFDLAALLESTFASTRDAIASIIPAFGANTIAAGATAEMTRMVSTIVDWARAHVSVLPGAAGSGPVVDQVRGVAARFGWGEGAQWDALSTLIAHESSWNPAAQNPTSTAFGLGQLLDGTWAGTGIAKTGNPALQAEAMDRYIQGRYGDPVGAWNFWQGHHWYDNGGYLPPGLSLSYNGTGHFERVLSPQQELSLVSSRDGGGQFTGSLYLDSAQFLGQVRGEIQRANDTTGRAITRRTRM